MTKKEAVMHYTAAMAVFRKWLDDGLISSGLFAEIEAAIAEKYSLSSSSIYRENSVI